MITDCHIHIEPIELYKPRALELMKHERANFDEIAEYCRSPKAFLKYLDRCGVDRAALINRVAPEVIAAGSNYQITKLLNYKITQLFYSPAALAAALPPVSSLARAPAP